MDKSLSNWIASDMKKKSSVAIAVLGVGQDARGKKRRPTLDLCAHPDLEIGRLVLIVQDRPKHLRLAEELIEDIKEKRGSIDTEIHRISSKNFNPYSLEDSYKALRGLFVGSKRIAIDYDREDYYFGISTGTMSARVSIILLRLRQHYRGHLYQSLGEAWNRPKSEHCIDLEGDAMQVIMTDQGPSRIAPKSAKGVKEWEDVMRAAVQSNAPILLTGPTGCGKTRAARKIFEVKKNAGLLGEEKEMVSVNCGTLQGDLVATTLFGHEEGAFTGAKKEGHRGFLDQANKTVLFLDEIGELGLAQQKMILTAIETGSFTPLGTTSKEKSDFHLIAATNKDLYAAVRDGSFREDLLARINVWHHDLPGLRDAPIDFATEMQDILKDAFPQDPQLKFEPNALGTFVDFARSEEALWLGNYRDLKAAITRMVILSERDSIGDDLVAAEIRRLVHHWNRLSGSQPNNDFPRVERQLGEAGMAAHDPFLLAQLEHVLKVFERPSVKSMAAAGRILFANSRLKKSNPNDTKRVADFLKKFGLDGGDVV